MLNFKSKIILITIISLIAFGCKELVEPVHDNIYDPRSNNFVNPVPSFIRIDNTSDAQYRLFWNYNYLNQVGFILERSIDNELFKIIYQTDNPTISTYYENNPTKSSTYKYRIKAFKGTVETDYSKIAVVNFNPNESLNLNISKRTYFNGYGGLITLAPNGFDGAILTDEIRLFSVYPSFKVIKILKTIDVNNRNVTAMNISPDSRYFVYLTDDKKAYVYKDIFGNLINEFSIRNDNYTLATINSKYNLLICSGLDNKIDIYNVESGNYLTTFDEHLAPITTMAFDKSQDYLFSGGLDKKINKWHLNNLQIENSVNVDHEINSISINIDNSEVMVANRNKIDIFDINSLDNIVYSYTSPSSNWIYNAVYSEYGQFIIFNNMFKLNYLNRNENNEEQLTNSETAITFLTNDITHRYFIMVHDYYLTFFGLTYQDGLWEMSIEN